MAKPKVTHSRLGLALVEAEVVEEQFRRLHLPAKKFQPH
jgi:hypothetical protein